MSFSSVQVRRRRLPAKWPSPHHHKCDNPKCAYPNPPQAAPGRYACLGRSGDVCCKGQYKVSLEKAKSVDMYWRNKFFEESKSREREYKKRRQEEAYRWEMRKRREEEERRENEMFDEMFLMEERRRREAKRKLNIDQQRLLTIHAKLKEIEVLMKGFEEEDRVADDNDNDGDDLELRCDTFGVGLRQELTSLHEEYTSLFHSVEERRGRR